ncbi:MAG: NAD(P)H-binding protein [Aestuariivirga sp.]|uniref:NAD-dependent epimerase/dehydratase family protein n=1 Tax=Aestuariivirga sp. TaxID=2650926 RepID=UPI0025B934FE|nr:NAD-dependent epimerase/dehydratase family protein [Aestuariivirga sp.]MCA3562326.1 NAD(P)H-binding protein [Aestuariivirga sp.]
MKLAVIGAGVIGRSVAAAFHAVGEPLRLVGRRKAPLAAAAAPGDEIVIADVSTPAGCRSALEGCDAAVYALGLPYTTEAFAAYPPMMLAFVSAARELGVKRLLLISNVYPYGLPRSATVAEDHPREPIMQKGQYRKEQEDILLAAAAPGMETISLRLPDFYGPGVENSLLTLAAKAAATGATGTLLGPAGTPHEFVFTPDVGPVVKALLEHQGPVAGAYNLAGAGIITQRGLAELLYQAAGRPPKLRVMPPWQQSLAGLFMPVLRELKDVRYLSETPVLLDDTKLRSLLPGLRKTPYEEGARLTVAAAGAKPT